ncbi:MAG: hypothetical protein AAF253_02925 [Pseudomonadota bacterium]
MKKLLAIGIASALLFAGFATLSHAQESSDTRAGDREMHREIKRAIAEARFDALDGNGDGEITRAEVDAKRMADFARADTNADGVLSIEESQAWKDAKRAERQAVRAQAQFTRADVNGDGVIGPDEFGSRNEKMFDRVDANEDGIITTEEAEDSIKRMGKKRRMGLRGQRGE